MPVQKKGIMINSELKYITLLQSCDSALLSFLLSAHCFISFVPLLHFCISTRFQSRKLVHIITYNNHSSDISVFRLESNGRLHLEVRYVFLDTSKVNFGTVINTSKGSLK